MESSESNRRGAAVHEAGHALVASALGCKVQELRIKDNGSGTFDIKCGVVLPIIDQIAIAEAGMAAVELLEAPTSPQAGLSDAAKVREILEDYPDDQIDHLAAEGHKRAMAILMDRQSVLVALADALLSSSFLDETALVPFLS